ncbi:MAG: hypothetical protein EBR20_07900 [Bacteroidetes bacterium]|nr:hypothetical protein [Bacteroidota bacterium]
MIRAIESAVLAVCLMGCVAGPAAAQFNYGGGGSRTARAVGPLLTVVDFSFRPPQAPDVSFEYSDPAIGLFYSREGFMGRLVRGSGMDADGDKVTLVDGSVDAWAAVRPFGSPDSKALDVFFPLACTETTGRFQSRTKVRLPPSLKYLLRPLASGPVST